MARPRAEETGVRIHVRVTKKQYVRLKHRAAQGGYSISETLRRAIDTFLESLK